MSAETNQRLVRTRFKDLHPEFGKLMDRTIGVENSGRIPLEVGLEVLERRATETGLGLTEVFKGEPPGIFSRLFVIKAPSQGEIVQSTLIFEFENCLWVSNSGFDDFKEIFMND